MNRMSFLLLFMWLLPTVVWSQTPVGGEFQVNSYTTGNQDYPSAAMDAAGNFVVVWQSGSQNGDSFGQRFDSAGNPVGGEFQVNSYTTGNQYYPSAAMDAAGNFVVVWSSGFTNQDGSGYGIFGQRFASDGPPVGSEFQVNSFTTGFQTYPSTVMDAAGNFVVVWLSSDGSNFGVFGQRFDSAGNPVGGEFQVNSYTTGQQSSASVAMDAAGNFVVVWHGRSVNNYDVFGQQFDSAGTPVGGEFQVNTFTYILQVTPSAAMDAAGNFVVVWVSSVQDGSSYGVFGQQFDSAGTPVDGEFQVNSFTTGYQFRPSTVMDAAGNFVVVWDSGRYGRSYGVFGQRFDSAGTPVGGEFQVNSYTTGYHARPSAAMNADGDFVVAWSSLFQDGDDFGIFGQRFLAGSAGVPGVLSLSVTTNQTSFTTGDNLTISVGVDNPGIPATVDFYFGALLPDGNTIVFFTDLNFNFDQGVLTDLSTLSPIASGVNLSGPFTVNNPSFFSYVWTGGEPPGTYTFFLVAVIPGGFADGTADPGDIIGLVTAEVTLIP